jgi:hypothetical protein
MKLFANDAATAGDSLVTINGISATASSLLAWRKLMQHEDKRITMTVRRGGETKTIQFTTRRII